GNNNTDGSRNVFLGTRSGNNNVVGNDNVFLGYRAGYYETGSDKLYISNGQYDADVLIYGDFASKEVGINTLDPTSELEIYNDADDFVGIYITNPNTGISSSEGIYFKNEDGSVTGIRLQNSDQMSIFNNRPSGYISWSTAGNQRMTIANNGNVGIGTGTPGNMLHVDGTVQIGSAETIADIGAYVLGCDANWYPATDNTRTLGASGYRWTAVWAVDGTINTSDIRLKEGIRDIGYGLSEIMELRPISFTWRDRPEAGERLGLVAQDVQSVMSEVVADEELVVEEGEYGPTFSTKPAENLGIYYNQLVPVLIKAVQEQQGMITEQAERIAELEARIAQIERD
ncbi:tail fiber domain-containing protein, partial [Candidatus Eisenbacteria bacterium]